MKKQEKNRDRRDVLDKMPMLPGIKMTEKQARTIYDLIEKSIDNPIFVLKMFNEYQTGRGKVFIVNKEENRMEGVKEGSTVMHRYNAMYRVLEIEEFRPSFMGKKSGCVALLVEEIDDTLG